MSQKLNRITVISGAEGTGKISNALFLTQKFVHKTAFLDMDDPGMIEGIIPDWHLEKDTKAIIISNVEFSKHTAAVEAIASKDKFSFRKPGDTTDHFIKDPYLFFLTTTEQKNIPLQIFKEKPGFLTCG